MKELKEEVKALDQYSISQVKDVVELMIDPGVNFTPPAEASFLRMLSIPASYYKNASEDLKKRMLNESSASKKEERLRLSRETSDGDVIGIGPNIDEKISMGSVLNSFKGKLTLTKGSFLNKGSAYLFYQFSQDNVGGELIQFGYNVILSSMFMRGFSIKPMLMVVKCTNGAVSERHTGKEFTVSPNLIAPEYITAIQDSIVGVLKDVEPDFKRTITNAQAEKVDVKVKMNEVFEGGKISKTLYQAGMKIVGALEEGIKFEDAAAPTQANTMWDLAQILSYTVRNSDSPSGKLSAETAIMGLLN